MLWFASCFASIGYRDRDRDRDHYRHRHSHHCHCHHYPHYFRGSEVEWLECFHWCSRVQFLDHAHKAWSRSFGVNFHPKMTSKSIGAVYIDIACAREYFVWVKVPSKQI